MRLNSLAVFGFLCGAMLLALAAYGWRRRAVTGARVFSALLVGISFYIVGYSLELASLNVPNMLLWGKLEYLGTCTFPTLFLVFVLQYTHHDPWLSRRNLVLLSVIPVLLLILRFTDDSTHWLYSTTSIDTTGSIPLLAFTPGPLYLAGLYNALPAVLGILLLWQQRSFTAPLYRGRATFMAVIALLPLLIYVAYLGGFQPFASLKHLDYNAFVYPFWGLGIGWTIFQYRLFDLAPIARETLIENLSDGVVVVDLPGRVIDANPAIQRIFGWARSPVGQPAAQVFSRWEALARAPAIIETPGSREPLTIEVKPERAGPSQFYDVNLATLKDHLGQGVGQLIILHNITERMAAQEKLRELSLVDELTGLNNRRGFNLLATQLLQMADRTRLTAALIYVDLDGLKAINDNLGHSAGDQALVDTARLLKGACRSSDIVARLGGDEFVILALESKENSSAMLLARLQEHLEAHNRQDGRGYALAISLGSAAYAPGQGHSLAALLAEADHKMYAQKQARKQGRATAG